MFLMVQCYDVMDHVHVRCHMVEADPLGGPGATVLRLSMEAHRPDSVKSERDYLAWLGEELIDLAHSANPLL